MTRLIPQFFPLLFLLLIYACDGQNVSDDIPQTDPPASVNYLALGDSYTIGQSVAAENSYPIQLEEKLKAAGIPWSSTRIIAKTGWRTDQLQTAVEAEELLTEYQLVSLLIGVNNQFQNRSLEVYETEFRELLEKAIALAGGDKSRVFVLSIPDYAYTFFGQSTADPEAISTEIDQFNASNSMITMEAGVAYYDITAISRQGLDRPELVSTDKLHPSGEMYSEWIESLWESVKATID